MTEKALLIKAFLGFFLSFFLVLGGIYFFIKYMKTRRLGQEIRKEGPSHHHSKRGTPTMGGLVIILVSFIVNLFLVGIHNFYFLFLSFVLFSFALIGFMDDYFKLVRKRNLGVSGKAKLFFQTFIVIFIYLILKEKGLYQSFLEIPFTNFKIEAGFFYLPFLWFLIVGSSNAVNLTDGLDGLVAMPLILIFLVLGGFSFCCLELPFKELIIIAAVFAGGLFGFLWHNFYPAKVFMGDVGSLAFGGLIAAWSVLLKKELLLGVIGFIFVLEALSVIFQVAYFKLTHGKRIFRMAPIHHHFELKGIPEPKVVVCFWIVSFLCAALGLLDLLLKSGF